MAHTMMATLCAEIIPVLLNGLEKFEKNIIMYIFTMKDCFHLF